MNIESIAATMAVASPRKNVRTKKYVAIGSSHNRDEKKKKNGCNPLQNNASLQPKKQSMPSLKKMVARGF